VSAQPLPDFLTATERAIYETGCRDLMAAILEARRSGQHGTLSLACGMDPRLRSAEVVRSTRRTVIVVVSGAARA